MSRRCTTRLVCCTRRRLLRQGAPSYPDSLKNGGSRRTKRRFMLRPCSAGTQCLTTGRPFAARIWAPAPVVLLSKAFAPLAVLKLPVLLLPSVARPVAVLEPPVVLSKSANTPAAVLFSPVVLFKSAPAPVAVLLSAVSERSVPAPMAVLRLPVRLLWSEKPTSHSVRRACG